ncbi:hypothetical protein ACWEGE_12055 [Amycolatopsis sp. NPDC004747]
MHVLTLVVLTSFVTALVLQGVPVELAVGSAMLLVGRVPAAASVRVPPAVAG